MAQPLPTMIILDEVNPFYIKGNNETEGLRARPFFYNFSLLH